MTSIQFRRRLIVILLLCVAVAGAVIRQLSAPGSTRHDIGTVMMLLWLAVIGQVVGWVFGKLRRLRERRRTQEDVATAGPPAFDESAPFAPQLWVELTLRLSSLPAENFAVSAGVYGCALVVGTQGFSARWRVEPGHTLPRGTPQPLQVEFLKPALALAAFAPGTPFRMLVGESFIGDGQVLRPV